jgi:excisionase family DNA binding protein
MLFALSKEGWMTVPARALPFGNGLPSANDQQIANQLRQILAAQKDGQATLRVLDPRTRKPVEITLSPAMSDLFLELLRHVGRGDAVTLVPIEQMLTTQQAADILNMSRPFLIKLIEMGDIAHSMVGRHRRLKAEDVFAFKASRDAARAAAMQDLIADGAELY